MVFSGNLVGNGKLQSPKSVGSRNAALSSCKVEWLPNQALVELVVGDGDGERDTFSILPKLELHRLVLWKHRENGGEKCLEENEELYFAPMNHGGVRECLNEVSTLGFKLISMLCQDGTENFLEVCGGVGRGSARELVGFKHQGAQAFYFKYESF